jgi:two-component system, sensor histidine kinase YesM
MEKKGSKQLYNKLLFIYTAVIASVVLALMFSFWNSTRNRYLERNQEYLHRMHEEAVEYINDCRDISTYLHEELYKSNMEMNDLLHYLTDNPEKYQEYRLDTYSQYKLLDYNGIEDFSATAFEAYPTLKRLAFVSYSKGDLTSFNGSQSIYHREDGGVALEQIKNGNLAESGEFSFLKEIRDPLNMQNVGAMIVTFHAKRFGNILAAYNLPELIVYNESGTLIYDSCPDCTVEEIENAEELEEKLNAYIQSTNLESYHIICYLKKAKASEIPFSIMIMIAGVALAVFFVSEFLVHYYLKHVSARLNGILDGMTQVMGGDLTVRLVAEKNGDELDVIASHFNEMCEKLDLHIQKSYLAEIEQKNAEMAALQSQINPHFLYNTLEAIRMKAICNGDSEVGKMLYSMAVTFRSQLKEADIITLAQELHYCKKYLELFEYRYPNQFKSSVDCPLEYMQVPIIKFVLQPIIENYFIHGIRMRDNDNFIRIMVEKKEDDYEIIVEDNGRGMSEEDIREKNRQLIENVMEKNKSIGISNVNRRVKAVYGNTYGVRMEQVVTGGLRVLLRFKPEEDNENEKSNDC